MFFSPSIAYLKSSGTAHDCRCLVQIWQVISSPVDTIHTESPSADDQAIHLSLSLPPVSGEAAYTTYRVCDSFPAPCIFSRYLRSFFSFLAQTRQTFLSSRVRQTAGFFMQIQQVISDTS